MNVHFLRSKVVLSVGFAQTGGRLMISVTLWQLARDTLNSFSRSNLISAKTSFAWLM